MSNQFVFACTIHHSKKRMQVCHYAEQACAIPQIASLQCALCCAGPGCCIPQVILQLASVLSAVMLCRITAASNFKIAQKLKLQMHSWLVLQAALAEDNKFRAQVATGKKKTKMIVIIWPVFFEYLGFLWIHFVQQGLCYQASPLQIFRIFPSFPDGRHQ